MAHRPRPLGRPRADGVAPIQSVDPLERLSPASLLHLELGALRENDITVVTITGRTQWCPESALRCAIIDIERQKVSKLEVLRIVDCKLPLPLWLELFQVAAMAGTFQVVVERCHVVHTLGAASPFEEFFTGFHRDNIDVEIESF
jgi:hypothetical protein